MKVLRLVEADSNVVMSVKNKFNNDPDNNSKMQTLKGFLINQCGVPAATWNALEKLGINFLSQWMNSFKFEEAGRTDNEFIMMLKDPASPIFTQSADRFQKAYNAYASNFVNSEDELEYSPLFNDSFYRYSGEDIKKIMNYWSQACKKYGDDKRKLIDLFYEQTTNNLNDINAKWRVRTVAELEKIIRDTNDQNSSDIQLDSQQDENQLNNLIRKNDHNREYAKQLLATLENEANNIQ